MTKHSISRVFPGIANGDKTIVVNIVVETDCEDSEDARAQANLELETWLDKQRLRMNEDREETIGG